ncbi:MAG: lariatin family lasso peptide [Rhodococcus sp. (in: high G+C Gram-positive bacteria)]
MGKKEYMSPTLLSRGSFSEITSGGGVWWAEWVGLFN